MANLALAFDILARDRASDKFEKVGRAADDAGKRGSRFGSVVQKASGVAKVALAGLAAGAVAFGKSSVEAYVDASKQQRVLEDAYKRFPAVANVSIDALRDQAQALQNTTKFDGDAVNAMQGSLAAYKLTGAQIQQLTPLVLDYAEKTGKDLPTAAQDLGKAILGQGRSLKAVGINFKDTGSAAGNFEELMGGLRQQVGGFAASEGKSAEGQAAILANNFGDLQEEIGSKLLPVGVKLLGWLSSAFKWMQENADLVKVLIGVVGTLATGLGALMVINKVRTAMLALNLVMAANPIGLVVTAIAALVAGLIYAYQNSETFRNIVNTAFEFVKKAAIGLALVAVKAFHFMLNVWLTVAGGILDAAAWAFGWVPGLGPKLQTASQNFHKFKDQVNSTLSKVETDLTVQLNTEPAKRKAEALAKYVRTRNYTAVVRTITPQTSKLLLPGYASGGTNIPEGWAVVGEQGPELAYLPGGSTILPAKQSASILSGGSTSSGATAAGMGYARLHPHDIATLADAIASRRMSAVVDRTQMMRQIGDGR